MTTLLNEKELAVIEHISDTQGILTQRDIANHANFSVGLTNLILKKLTKTGYIKVKQLTPKKMSYMLTRRGMVEKAKKSYLYIVGTISRLKHIESEIVKLFIKEARRGKSVFGILGEGEFVDIVALSAKKVPGVVIKQFGNNLVNIDCDDVDMYLDCRNNFSFDYKGNDSVKVVNLIEYITKKRYENSTS